MPFIVSTERGVASIVEAVEAVEKERASARAPGWPWVPVGLALRYLPLPLARRLMG
jgi:hypothetical protein